MDDLGTLFAARNGFLMRHELLDLGYSDALIRAEMRAGRLARLRHGTYAWGEHHRRRSDVQRHEVLVRSVLAKLGPAVVASHQSAAALHGFDLYGVDLTAVHVTRVDGRTGRREAGVVYHEGAIGDDVVELGRVPVTSAARAVFETASFATTESGIVLASSALHSTRLSKDELLDAGRQFDHWRGTRTARLAIRLADGRLESVGESRSWHMFWQHGVPMPDLQVVIVDTAGREIARTDFDWPLFRHVGEFDGMVKYGRLNPYVDEPGQAITDEKVREDLVRATGRGMSRWTWSGLDEKRRAATVKSLMSAMELSRRLYARGAVHVPLS